jgi:UDP-N-acetyl-D-mannosaminuronic acid dehydrogenase
MSTPDTFSTVSLIGLGYIGLPTAAMFAARRVRVIGVDVNPHAVETINQGRIHIVEPELDMIVHGAVREGHLRATLRPEPADAFLIAVPTPFQGDHEPDLSFVKAAVESIAPVLKKGDLVVLESTSPVGTTESIVEWLAAARADLRFPLPGAESPDVNVAYCPERVLPGHVVRELIENDRIIGGITARCSERAVALYRTFVRGELLVTSARTAEMCKLTENSFRDVNIAFANELSVICDKLGIDVWELIRLANRHPRVKILQPGAGVGGHCIAVDPWFIVDKTPDEARLIRTAREVNDGKPHWVVEKVAQAVDGLAAAGKPATQVRIAALGLAFKPDIDDLRESPALHIAQELAAVHGDRLVVVEPHVTELPPGLAGVRLLDAATAIAQADVVVLLVAHSQFKSLPFDAIRRHQALVDVVGMSNPTGSSR